MDEHEVIVFYNKFSPRVLRYLQNHLPKDIAQEILNDVFIDAIDEMSTLKKQKNLQAWIYRIAHNKMVDYYRKKKIKSFLFSQIPYLELVANEIHQPEFIIEKNKIRDRIESSLLSLSLKNQNILRMHYEEQIPIKQIAILLNLSPKATESLLFRARQNFIKIYERT